MAVYILHTFCAGYDISCSSSGNEEQRAHVRKYSDFPGLPMRASKLKDLSLSNIIYLIVWCEVFLLSFICPKG